MNAVLTSPQGEDSDDSTKGTLMVSVPTADLQAENNAASETVSQLLYGEEILVLETLGEWFRVRGVVDGYEGYSHQRHFAEGLPTRTHRVANRATLLFSEPDIKSPVRMRLTFASRLALRPESNEAGDFLRTMGGDFVWKAHCQRIDQSIAEEPVQIVRRHFLSTPYLWGGRSSDGLDCSGLVQLVASMVGIELPRDSRDQEHVLSIIDRGDPIEPNDLVFWPGHVAWAVDTETVIHANAASMSVHEEPLEAVSERAGEPSSCRRFKQTL